MSHTATIYHNPQCGTSRNVLKILQDAGYTINIVEYLQTGWRKEQLLALMQATNLSVKELLRTKNSPAESLGLLKTEISDAEILAAMLEHPILVNRPIVQTARGTLLCRPSETVLDLLDTWPKGPYYKEDGECLIDEQGKRVS